MFQLDFVVEGDVGALDIYRQVLAVNLYSNKKEELQPTVPDVVWAQVKQFFSGWTSEVEVVLIISMELLVLEWPALQMLVSLIDLMPDLQCSVDANVSLSLNYRVYLSAVPFKLFILLHDSTCYSMFLPIVEARSQCPLAAAWCGHPSCYNRNVKVGSWGPEIFCTKLVKKGSSGGSTATSQNSTLLVLIIYCHINTP